MPSGFPLRFFASSSAALRTPEQSKYVLVEEAQDT